MVTHLSQIPGSDECYFRTFCFAIPSAKTEEKMKRLRTFKLDMTPADLDSLKQTRPGRDVPELPGAVDLVAQYEGDPQPDAANEQGKFCSVGSLCRASGGKVDYGYAAGLARTGAVKPDATIAGRPHWKAGASARAALKQLLVSAPVPSQK